MKADVLRRVRHGDRVVDLEAENTRLREVAATLRHELEEVLSWAILEKAALRKQEIASIRSALAKATGGEG